MRKIVAVEFVSLDGVIQAPGGPEEDPSNGFKFGGWLAPFSDEKSDEALGVTYGPPYDLLLGKKTYDIFAGYWPKFEENAGGSGSAGGEIDFAKQFNATKKYVATHSKERLTWNNSQALSAGLVDELKKLKSENGNTLLVVGSADFLHTLLAHDLVDELHLHIAPVILGQGKRLFDETSMPRTLELIRSDISSKGVLLMNYRRAGEVKTGKMGV